MCVHLVNCGSWEIFHHYYVAIMTYSLWFSPSQVFQIPHIKIIPNDQTSTLITSFLFLFLNSSETRLLLSIKSFYSIYLL